MARTSSFQHIFHQFSPALRRRGVSLRAFSHAIGLVIFGSVHQHDDEYEAIRGFTASLTHRDTHFAVGTYGDFNIRLVNRFDTVQLTSAKRIPQVWTILEIELTDRNIPHVFFVPTGREGGEYSRLYATHPTLQPINSMILSNKSPEFHGRFQIVTNPTHSHVIETLFSSPVIVGIGNRLWPHGIEIEHGKLLIYITEHRLTKTVLEAALASGLWLADTIDDAVAR